MKVSELSGQALDMWVARAEGKKPHRDGTYRTTIEAPGWNDADKYWPHQSFNPHRDWEIAGPIIEKAAVGWRNRGATSHVGAHKGLSSVDDEPWEAWFCDGGDEGGNGFLDRVQTGKTLLIASMRAFVASKYGEEVPDAEG